MTNNPKKFKEVIVAVNEFMDSEHYSMLITLNNKVEAMSLQKRLRNELDEDVFIIQRDKQVHLEKGWWL
jgi:hypothetical protein